MDSRQLRRYFAQAVGALLAAPVWDALGGYATLEE